MFQLQVETPHKPMGQTISKRTEGQHEVHHIHPGSEDRSLRAIIPLEVQGLHCGHIWTRDLVGILYPKKQLKS